MDARELAPAPIGDHGYRALVESASDAIVCVDVEQRIHVWNAAAAEMFGYSRDEMMGESLSRLLPEMARAGHGELVRGFAASGSGRIEMGTGRELSAIRSGGDRFPVEIRLAKIPGDDGPLFMASVRDVSRRVEAELARFAQHERFESLVSNSFDAVTVLDVDGTITDIQPTPDGYDQDQLIGTPVGEWSHLGDVDEVRNLLADLARRGDGATADLTHRCRFPGGYRWFESRLTNRLKTDSVGGIVMNGKDVTERVDAEDLRRAQSQWYESLALNTSDSVAVLDAAGVFTYIQPSLDGHVAGEMVGQASGDWVHPDDVGKWNDSLRELVNEGDGATADLTIRGRFPDGYRWLESHLRNMLGQPAVRGVVATGRDITGRVEARHLRETQAELFRALVANNSDSVAVLDIDGVITYTQPFPDGNPASELLGRANRDLVHPDDVEAWDEALSQLVTGGPGATDELTVRGLLPDGYHWLESRFTNMVDHPTVKGIMVNTRDVTDRRDFELRLEHQATHDALTGLPNRGLLFDRVDHALARAARHGGVVAVLLLDLDRFKIINDTKGHKTGDRVLVEVAKRLRTVVRDGDTLARHGGDEFIVLVEDNTAADGAWLLAERVRGILQEPIRVDNTRFHTGASIGIACSTDGDQDAATLLSNADAAMYRAKQTGRDRIEAFDNSLRDQLQHQLETENELREALQRDELRVYYQPILNVASANIEGFEALVRWQHPIRGLLAPDKFIPVAEEAGLIGALDMWVLQTAAEQLVAWGDTLGDRPYMSVNLSAHDLIDPTTATEITDIVRAVGIEPDRLCFEVTETALIDHPALATETLERLRQLGAKIALDDFGTGYSSLTHLQTMPLTHIKIDRSFTNGLGINTTDNAIVQSTIMLAHHLGLTVIAEGVETAAQLAVLHTHDCDLAQGYYLGRPQPAEQLEQLDRK